MQFIIAIIIAIVFAIICVATIKWKNNIIRKTYEEMKELENSYTFVYEGFPWGPEITKAIVYSNKAISDMNESDLNPELFTVAVTSETKKDNNTSSLTNRQVSDVIFCDMDGNPMDKSENPTHILLSFDNTEYSQTFSPFINDENIRWKSNYSYIIKHPKFSSNIMVSNDPIVLDSAIEKIQELGLNY